MQKNIIICQGVLSKSDDCITFGVFNAKFSFSFAINTIIINISVEYVLTSKTFDTTLMLSTKFTCLFMINVIFFILAFFQLS